MNLRPVKQEPPEDDSVAAMFSPNKDKTDDEIVEWLKLHNATDVEVLAEGFISACACTATLKAAEEVASVEIKRQKMPRRGAGRRR